MCREDVPGHILCSIIDTIRDGKESRIFRCRRMNETEKYNKTAGIEGK
jgi:hypothetical protein